jgi:hypothetical protein
MDTETRLQGISSWFALAASAGTLICCAIPIVLVALGLGAAVAAASSSVPALIVLSEHKDYVFTGSALLMGVSWWLHRRQGLACPSDPELAETCRKTRRWSQRILWSALAIWGVGFLSAYLAFPLRSLLGP